MKIKEENSVLKLSLSSKVTHSLYISVYCTPMWLGFDIRYRGNTDTAIIWTYVDINHTFEVPGTVDAVQLYAGVPGRPLNFGIYRKLADCRFTLIQQLEIKGSRISSGYNMVSYFHKDIIKGDSKEDVLQLVLLQLYYFFSSAAEPV